MKILVTGICGFAGSVLARELKERIEGVEIIGLDNLCRAGSEVNRRLIQESGMRYYHGDIRQPSDLEALPRVDWVIDAAANPSVLAGIGGGASSRQLMEHNLVGTLNLLEFCKCYSAGFLMLSTSRVYASRALSQIPMAAKEHAFCPELGAFSQPGLSIEGVSEYYSTAGPVSLYGAAKLASEVVALEYGEAFDFPVRINRCGVLAGAGQFGKADQGILSFWIHSYRAGRPLKYIGFKGTGHQTRDFLHPRDLAELVTAQLRDGEQPIGALNVSGGRTHAMSLAQITAWCAERFGKREVQQEENERPYDVPWLVLDSSRARETYKWQPEIPLECILDEIARHAEQHPEWLKLTSGS